ncbi:MAG TPA: hypothetical protein VJ976_02290 [Ornithinimicrobium sp.]|uniref:hypothetical protein n=1 Tax=Ornithinimicrobium sp. TaxID=1977084 RepID=UPI002B48CD24|nr:hypothetical protein [Ornithinimicrobium sp.]HKJ11199.1 hypothetical protein [Ornithinimicrobium sp.]
MVEESWLEARLIPTSGINGAEEQERRATSALLAVISAVKEYGHSLLRPLGAPSGRVECYIEVPFALGDSKVFPDGLIRVSRGSRSWVTLVEVKTGNNKLESQQLENYLDIARTENFDAVLTISNEISAMAGQHPTKVDGRKLRKVDLHHYSWSRVLTEAVMQKEFRGVADPDQAWILGELVRYLEHSKSGALEFADMGDSWVPVRDSVKSETLRATDSSASMVAARFDALLRFASLRLGRRLGTEVVPALSRRELKDPSARREALTDLLCGEGRLSGAIRVPNTVGPITITADLRSGQIFCHVDIGAPREGRPRTRVNWLVRQLKNAPGDVRVECYTARSRGSGAAELLGAVRQDPLLLITDPKREVRSFRVATTTSMGAKRGRGRGSFIDSVLDSIDGFYADVLGDLKAWTAAPPKLRPASPEDPADAEAAREAALSSTDYSSQDGPEASSREADGTGF